MLLELIHSIEIAQKKGGKIETCLVVFVDESLSRAEVIGSDDEPKRLKKQKFCEIKSEHL